MYIRGQSFGSPVKITYKNYHNEIYTIDYGSNNLVEIYRNGVLTFVKAKNIMIGDIGLGKTVLKVEKQPTLFDRLKNFFRS